MDSYSDRLKAYLEGQPKQDDFAARIKKSQPSVSRYASGDRFPDAETARVIDEASGGAVPFTLWQEEALRKLGLGDLAKYAA